MISIDDHPPPDPSSSHHHHHQHQHHHQQQQQISHDLKVSDIDLKSPDAVLHDTNNQLPNFSIRDYVLGLRNKDVSCNWPFSSTSLQLCLKHGVKNLLPPFQSLDSLRNNSSDQSCLPDEETVTVIITHDQNRLREDQSSGCVTVSTNPRSKSKSKEKEKPPAAASSLPENIRKSKLVMKLNQGVETVDQETSMASKICPVCKIFSSSSNTTLNAHIDQCLTGDQGTMKWSTDHDLDYDHNPKVIVKHRVKPRKMRLMVEIYKTAPHCTIEELDKRNGTNWATNSSFKTHQEFQFDHGVDEEEKLQEPRKTTTDRDVADNKTEGDVYIDTDGTKVRILSVPKSGNSLDNNNNNNNHGNGNGNGKFLKGVKGGKFVKKFKSNVHDHKKHHKKSLKVLTPNARKLCSPKLQVRNGEEDDAAIIIRPPWACSKRTNLGKRKHRKNLQNDHLGKSLPLSCDDVAVSQSRKKTRASEFRKESSSMHEDNDEGSPDSRNCDSFDTRSKGSKFLRKSASSVDETFDQESSKESSGNEEHDEHEESSSDGVEAAADNNNNNNDESVRNETAMRDQVCVFTGLSNSFDPEFSKCVEQLLVCSTNRAQDVEKHDLFFHEGDPIPIPGPPGSFLPPSPGGDMVVSDQEQLQANSSSTTTTTTRVEIENHHHDNMDRDSLSNSPVSTVSNPSNLGKSDSRSTSVVQDQIMHAKSFTSFKNDHQPCCCSRKDTAAFSYNQESSVRRQQMTESNKSLTGFNFSTSGQAPPPETAIFPAMKKPVLRLMGKNLTVVKTDEDHVSVSPPPSSQLFRAPQLPQPTPPPVIFSQPFNFYPPFQNHGGFAPHMDRYGHGGTGPPYMGHTHTVPHARSHHGHNSNEIIIIDDDLPENDSMRRNRGQMNPLYTMYYHSQSSGHLYGGGGGGGSGGGSTVFRGGGFNGDLGKWDVGSSSSTAHMRSSTSYYPPSYP